MAAEHALRHPHSTRVKDLVDLVLIAEMASFDGSHLRAALSCVFAGRSLQSLPATLPPPPVDWRTPYRKLAEPIGIEPDLDAAHARAAAFLDPVLAADSFAGRWDNVLQRWSISGGRPGPGR